MAKILDMPKLSPTMEEGQLAIWHKKEGDAVGVDDLLAEVETDKATMEFRSFDKGTLLKVLVPAGAIVKLGQAVAILGEPGEDITALLAATPTAAPAPVPSPTPVPSPPPIPSLTPTPPLTPAPAAIPSPAPIPSPTRTPTPSPTPSPSPTSGDRPRASPYVRKLAREQSLDLAGLAGTGPHGRIIARDLATLASAPRAASPAPAAPRAEAERKPLSMMRKTIARRLTESKQTVPHFYLTIDVDAAPLSALRETIVQDLASQAREGDKPEKVSVNDLLVKACAIALVRVPECNAQFDGDALLFHHRVDVSVAVAVPDGLLTPVVRDADRKSVLGIAREIRDLAARAKAKKLAPEEMTGGTFSISNLGMFGIDAFSAVINPPEGAILAVGRVRDEPVVQDGAVVPGKRLAMTLSCDHRVVDGAVGARFLAELRALVEHPTRILIG